MDILKNLNHRLSLVEGAACYGGEEDVKRVVSESPIQLPEDYTEFLKSISGGDDGGVEFLVDDGGLEIVIWDASMAMEKREEFSFPSSHDFMEKVWLIGDDLGDLVFCYGEGEEGFGIYRVSAGVLSLSALDFAKKIADTLTDFLVEGVGIDIATTLTR